MFRTICKYRLEICLFLIFSIFILSGIALLQKSTIIAYPDSDDYHTVVLQQMNSIDFWAGRRTLSTPLIWTILRVPAKDDIKKSYVFVPPFYTFFSLVSWGLFGFAVALALRKPWLKITAFSLILGLGLSQLIFFWNWTLLSESPFISSFVLLLAIAVFLIQYLRTYPALSWKQETGIALSISVVILFWSFTRDTNVFVALGLAILLSTWFIFFWKKIKPKLLISLLIIALFWIVACQLFTIQFAKRWQYPFIDVLGQRILTNEEYTAFFIAHGLPTTPEVMRFTGGWANSYDWLGLDHWLNTEAHKTYLLFLLSHPDYTFLEPIRNWEPLLDGDWSPYGKSTVHHPLQNRLSLIVWPQGQSLGIVTLFALVLILTVTAQRKLTPHLFFALALLILVIPSMLSTWHGDTREIVRHSVGSSLQLRIALILIIVFSLDTLKREIPATKELSKQNKPLV